MVLTPGGVERGRRAGRPGLGYKTVCINRTSGFGPKSAQKAHVRRDDAPALGGAHPCLALAPRLCAPLAAKFDVRGGEVTAISGDDGAQHLAGQPLRRPRRSKGLDLAVAVEVFGGAVAQRVRTVPEQLVEHVDLVVDQRVFIAVEG